MQTRRVGIIMNGVTGRMGTHQHLVRSVLAIIKEGGVRTSDDLVILPEPILTGRNERKLQFLANQHRGSESSEPLKWTTDLPGVLADSRYEVFFDASVTPMRQRFIEMAASAGKAIYCEKPTAQITNDALELAVRCEQSQLKNGVVQDKLWLPGLRKIKRLVQEGFFGRILSVRGEFGYWVFSGHQEQQQPQRPSWNYRQADGGGIILDMFCHWRYVIENLFGPIKRLIAYGNTDQPERIDESGRTYPATADDSAYAIFLLANGTVCQFNSSWCVRVRRDDLLTIQIDGTEGSAVAGLRDVWVQPLAQTPRPVWNPDVAQPIDFYENWQKIPDACAYANAFKMQWELFLRHLVLNEPFPWTLREGAKGVQLAELGLASWREHRWVDVPDL